MYTFENTGLFPHLKNGNRLSLALLRATLTAYFWGYFLTKILVTVETEEAPKIMALNKGSRFSKRAI